jgi:uncharacterized protein YjbI with pentapeptide repeats
MADPAHAAASCTLRADIASFQEVSCQERPKQPRSLLAPADLLTGTNLAGAELASTRTANFRGAKMTGADLTFAELRGADFTRADLRNAVLTEVCFDHTTQWGSSTPPTSSSC